MSRGQLGFRLVSIGVGGDLPVVARPLEVLERARAGRLDQQLLITSQQPVGTTVVEATSDLLEMVSGQLTSFVFRRELGEVTQPLGETDAGPSLATGDVGLGHQELRQVSVAAPLGHAAGVGPTE